MSGATFTLGELARRVSGGNLATMAKMLNDAGANPRLDENRPDPGALVDRGTVIDLYATRAGDGVGRRLHLVLLYHGEGDSPAPAAPPPPAGPGQFESVIVDAATMQDAAAWAAWELTNSAKILGGELLGDGTARAEIMRVADLSWYVNVWNCKGDLMLANNEGADTPAGDLFDLDAGDLAALIGQVVEGDHQSYLNMSGLYYPLSEESQAAFARLMATAKRKS